MQFINRFLQKYGEQQQNLIQIEHKKKHEILKNRLFLTSLINFIIFLIFVFSMCYYKWGIITIQIYLPNPSTANLIKNGSISLYFNLIYGKIMDRSYYETFDALSDQVCFQNDINCLSSFQELMCIGYLSFIILIIGSFFQMCDIFKMINYLCKAEDIIDYTNEKRDNLGHILTIGHYIVGITLNVFGLLMMQVSVNLSVSFWIFVGGIFCFIIIIIYQEISLVKLRQKRMILDLMERQRIESNKVNNEITIQLASESDRYL